METEKQKETRNRRQHDNPWHFLRNARKTANLSQEKLAEVCGSCQTNVGKWERGERAPSLQALPSIATALKIPLEVLAVETVKHFNQSYL
jgi:transcriptional regulator with XRE-family HTH domain